MDDSISFRLQSHLGGRYEVFEDFASGGVASVHLARHVTPSGLTKVVAVKRLHPQHAKDAAFRAALLDEARLVARIQHPNVVSVLDVCNDERDLFIAMEYVHGVSLARLCSVTAPRPVAPSIAAAVVASALKGLHAAHEVKGPDGKPLHLVHRDVSPQNILVGEDGVTRVIDFGLAYAIGRGHATQSGVVKGKPSYMSPEQVRGERVTRASDIFSAGVVLWGALTGQKLFDGETVEATIFKVLVQKARRPSELVPSISAALEAIVMRALEPAPTDRFSTALEMARALESAVASETAAVAEWVAEAGTEWLGEMSRRLREVDAAPAWDALVDSEDGDEDGPTLLQSAPIAFDATLAANVPTAAAAWVASAPARSKPRHLLTVALLLVAASIGWFVAHFSGRTTPASAVTATSSTNPPPASATAVPPSSSSDLAAADLLSPSIEVVEVVTPDAGAPTTPRSAPPAKPLRRPRCDDPLNPKCK